jgi:enoyl-CoA hydratase/carnithine racemase
MRGDAFRIAQEERMAVVETERLGQVLIVRMNRPERLNALNTEMRERLAETWTAFRHDKALEVAIFTGTGRGFCAGEDMKESLARGTPGSASAPGVRKDSPYDNRTIEKPIIVAVNGFAMGGGFMLVERADLRIAVRGAVFESSEAKRWLLGGYDHGVKGVLPHAVATELAFAYRFTAERLHQVGFLNRLVEPEDLMKTAHEMADHLMTLPPASRINTLMLMRAMRPKVSEELEQLAARLKEHGAKEDLMESRKAFAEKRPPNFKGWDKPEDRFRMPKLGDK